MKLLRRRPVNPDADSFTRRDIDASIVLPPLREAMRGRFYARDTRSHAEAWAERRDESLVRFADRVKRFVQPMGFVEAFRQDAPHASREVELRWLEATQAQDIAPEYAILAANGVEAFSLFTSYVDEDGEEHSLSEDFADPVDSEDDLALLDYPTQAAERLWSEAIAQTLDSRVESFLREADRQRWYCSMPKVAYYIADESGKRGIVPKARHPWTSDELRSALQRCAPDAESIKVAMERRQSAKWRLEREAYGTDVLLTHAEKRAVEVKQALNAWLDTLDIDARRTALEVLDSEERLEAEQDRRYAPNEPCPACEASIWMMLIRVTLGPVGLAGFASSDESCTMCRDSGLVSHTIGFDGVPAFDIEPMSKPHDPVTNQFAKWLWVKTFGIQR